MIALDKMILYISMISAFYSRTNGAFRQSFWKNAGRSNFIPNEKLYETSCCIY